MKSPRERMSEDEVWASIEQKWHKRNLERKASGIGKRKKKKTRRALWSNIRKG